MGLDKDGLLRAYRQMKTIREFEERTFTEIMNGQIAGFTHLYTGQEANAVGVCEHLSGNDTIISTHRGHGHCIARGADVKGMMAELWGAASGLCKGKGGSMHIADVDNGILGANGIVAGGPPISVGAALAAKIRGRDNVSVSFSGDGSVNQGTCFEAMNLAVVLKVPAIFVIENNYYSEHTSINYAVGCDDLKARTEGFGFPVFVADGADFFDVYRAAGEAIGHARAGNGPAGIFCEQGRFQGHFVGDPQGYRGEGELDNLRGERDCLQHFRARVGEYGDVSAEELDTIDAEVLSLIDEAVAEARTAPRPTAADLDSDVYINYAQGGA
ncbi:thiamine pyrophosphate-dependent dehydrogenase E1 component subunit alpha [Seongchinamella unica]|uniref:Thiamine pyrophosphate-dependent dehydrogenase E1 component subunit alpha n=1 Tax=Seongchinamella unica TaxID=2547392 RepID=A0A4R5LRC5_9GAMM|nr:thiamine pyrophosphate-dependent dehydrogenase E1 component subunit alpha [Seongchinamella unica]TDG13336.1 thiamine pyrophosphate-dependent dehydrogenase E1 component subunit alpha [Seongchinamella unica]